MKNWLTPLVAGLFVVGTLVSCDKDETKATITPSATLTATASTASVTLLQANSAQSAITYTWTPISFTMSSSDQTTPPEPNYYIQFAKTEDGFGFPLAEVNVGTNASKIFTVGELNSLLLSPTGINGAPNTPITVYARVVAGVGVSTSPDKHTFVSAPVALTATPYEVCVPPNEDSWALVGPAGAGWPGGDAVTEAGIELVWNCDDNAYEARTSLNTGDFKFRLNKGWTTNLGGTGADLVQGVTLAPNGPNLTIATAGTYTVKLTVTGSGASTTAGFVTVTP
jgi:hypothetical protein